MDQTIPQWLDYAPSQVRTYPRWQTWSRARSIHKLHGKVTIPAFSLEGIQLYYPSRLIAQFNYSVPKTFTFVKNPVILKIAGYLVCLKFRVGTTVYRYKMNPGQGEYLYAPNYTGQAVLPNFSFEIWSPSLYSIESGTLDLETGGHIELEQGGNILLEKPPIYANISGNAVGMEMSYLYNPSCANYFDEPVVATPSSPASFGVALPETIPTVYDPGVAWISN